MYTRTIHLTEPDIQCESVWSQQPLSLVSAIRRNVGIDCAVRISWNRWYHYQEWMPFVQAEVWDHTGVYCFELDAVGSQLYRDWQNDEPLKPTPFQMDLLVSSKDTPYAKEFKPISHAAFLRGVAKSQSLARVFSARNPETQQAEWEKHKQLCQQQREET